MPHHHPDRRPRSDSQSSSSSSASSQSSSSANSSAKSFHDDLESRRHASRRSKGSGSDSSSSRGSSAHSFSSSDSSDDDRRRQRRHHRGTKRRQTSELCIGVAIFGVCVVVALFYAYDKTSSAAATSSSTSRVASTTAESTTGSSMTKATSATTTAKSSSTSSSKAAFTTTKAASSTTTATGSSSSSSAKTATTATAAATTTSTAADPDNTGPYTLTVAYEGSTFFDGWTFFTDADPTNGQVTFLSYDDALADGLVSASDTVAVMALDNTTTLDSGGKRNSVRFTSNDPVAINSIVIADIAHAPTGCATWPAWWMVGTGTWPDTGEIDVFEGVNTQSINQITLHTKDSGCAQSTSVSITGTASTSNTDCDANADGNAGCSYEEVAANSYGVDFNSAGGGVFVTLFSTDAVSVWFWSRADIPGNIASGSPDSSTWGVPTASWPSDTCDISSYFSSQSLVFDLTLCGDWAGSDGVWTADSTCAAAASTCADYVLDPSGFTAAWWEVNYVKVYSTGS